MEGRRIGTGVRVGFSGAFGESETDDGAASSGGAGAGAAGPEGSLLVSTMASVGTKLVGSERGVLTFSDRASLLTAAVCAKLFARDRAALAVVSGEEEDLASRGLELIVVRDGAVFAAAIAAAVAIRADLTGGDCAASGLALSSDGGAWPAWSCTRRWAATPPPASLDVSELPSPLRSAAGATLNFG
ncbi:hypothetical protein Mapa_005602 [Marchantia paleacea]|nr:hypothetical protein Mapa_005602 [Marchantia paleacea]